MAAAGLQGLPTPNMDWYAADTSIELANFKSLCELYFDGPLSGITEEKKVKYLLIWIGQEGRDICKSWELQGNDQKSLKKTLGFI